MKHTGAGLALLVDFGSTYTKLVAVDLSGREIVAQSQAVTTVETDINLGLREALDQIEAEQGLRADDLGHRLACSSAAGGLRVVAIGLVKSLTVEAARQAALGAGARLIGAYGDHLNRNEVDEIVSVKPDMILLSGGTDGGDSDVIEHNASILAEAPIDAPIVVAGNKEATPVAAAMLRAQGKAVRTTENVLPRLQEINVEPAREVMRQVFMERIVEAKGLAQAEDFVGRVIMPTPAAVLQAARLLADGTSVQDGWESVMFVDIGGATTDVHSVAPDPPENDSVIRRGLPDEHARRTVEGDLGLRVSALSLLETVGTKRLRVALGDDQVEDDRIVEAVRKRAEEIGFVSMAGYDRKFDDAMARLCTEIGVERHVGRLHEHYLPTGFCFIQEGKDLTQVRHLIGTGGVFKHSRRSQYILSGGLFDERRPFELKPRTPRLHLDQHYVTWAMGLLAHSERDIALDILKRALLQVE